MLAFVAAVAFATIVAVVAGLVLAAASAMAHDLYVGVIRGEHATPQEQVRAARIATVIVGALAIVIGIAAKGQNVAHLVALAFAVAASANFPCVLLTLYWKRCNTGGIVLGMIVGTLTAIALVLVSPNMTYPKALKAAAQKRRRRRAARKARIDTDLAGRCRRPGEGRQATKAQGRTRQGRRGRQGHARALRRRRHLARGPREAAVRAAQPGAHLDPARLPRGDHRLAAVPRQACRGHVGRALRAPEHRHPRGEGGCALTPAPALGASMIAPARDGGRTLALTADDRRLAPADPARVPRRHAPFDRWRTTPSTRRFRGSRSRTSPRTPDRHAGRRPATTCT